MALHESPSQLLTGRRIYRNSTPDEVAGAGLPTEFAKKLTQESSLEAGEHFFLFPRPPGAPLELDLLAGAPEGCLVLEGEACCAGEAERLHTGDLVVVDGVDGPAVLTAKTRLRLQHTKHQSVSAPLDPGQLYARLARKDPQSTAHAARVRQLAREMGQALSLCPDELECLEASAHFHDIGKLAVPRATLTNPGRLSLGEWRMIVNHPVYGRTLLGRTHLATAAVVAEQHHERLDGSGYPYGLSGDEVSLESYLVGVADSFDAMTHERPYQRARGPKQALSELNRYANLLYPGELVAALNAVVKRRRA